LNIMHQPRTILVSGWLKKERGRAAGGVENLEAFMRKADAGHRKTASQVAQS